jgi:VIT family protein
VWLDLGFIGRGFEMPSRPSIHVEPRGAGAMFRHYIRDIVYGAADGIVTTFAVVAGVAGGSLSTVAVLVVGVANLAADGLSMGVVTSSPFGRTRVRARPSTSLKRKRGPSGTRSPRFSPS